MLGGNREACVLAVRGEVTLRGCFIVQFKPDRREGGPGVAVGVKQSRFSEMCDDAGGVSIFCRRSRVIPQSHATLCRKLISSLRIFSIPAAT